MEPGPHTDAVGIVLAMAYMAWTDHQIAEDEFALIRQQALDQGLSQDAAEDLLLSLQREGPTLSAVVSHLSPEARPAAAYAAYLTSHADQAFMRSENDAFDRLCEALELPPERRTEIRAMADRQLQAAASGQPEGLRLEDLL